MKFLMVLLLLLSACERKPNVPTSSVVAVGPPKPAANAAILAKFECNRCHIIDGTAPTTVNMDCRECHRQIIMGTYPEPTEYLQMWNRGLENMRDVPSLASVERRFTREWFVDFVQQPHDLRPRLGAMMPRLPLSSTDADGLADALGLTAAGEELIAGDIAAGRALANTKSCGLCHVMTGLAGGIAASAIPTPVDADQLARATLLAPDLSVTRNRYRRETLVAWLVDPASVKPDALMPKLGLTTAEANDVAAFLLDVELEPARQVPPMERLPVLAREVRWPEVQKRLFDEICLHCHSDPKYNEGDGGPGNTGGFGYGGKKLDVSSYERAVRDRAFYAPLADGTPKMVAHLVARHEEIAGRPTKILGMPLGFPPIDLERIQLLETWIAQGLQE